jgi:hypothetical protein
MARGGFSLLDGDPLFELQRAAHLVGGRHAVLPRALTLAAIGWLAPLLLTAISGRERGALVPLHTRFLVCIPVLLWAERFVDKRVRAAVAGFTERGIVTAAALPRFREIVASAEQQLHSVRAAVAIVAIAFAISAVGSLFGLLPHASALDWWIAYLSLPLFRIVLLRWLWRWMVWAMLLLRTSRLDLRLEPTHPDLAGGLGFLEHAATSFLSLQVAAGAVLAGRLATNLGGRAADLRVEKQEIIGFSLIAIAMTLGPLLPFCRKLVRTERLGKLDYGRLSSRHNQQFADRWLGAPDGAPLGDPSISSLADLGTSYGSIDRMRPLPIGRRSLAAILVVCLAPALPALLLHAQLQEMLTRVVKTLLF